MNYRNPFLTRKNSLFWSNKILEFGKERYARLVTTSEITETQAIAILSVIGIYTWLLLA